MTRHAKLPGLALALAAAAALAGCNSTGRSTVAAAAPPAAYATQAYTPPSFKLPEGSGCSGDVARWQAIQDNDYASGNIGPSVYKQIKAEIAAASSACAAGHDAEARAMVSASRQRHGYPS